MGVLCVDGKLGLLAVGGLQDRAEDRAGAKAESEQKTEQKRLLYLDITSHHDLFHGPSNYSYPGNSPTSPLLLPSTSLLVPSSSFLSVKFASSSPFLCFESSSPPMIGCF